MNENFVWGPRAGIISNVYKGRHLFGAFNISNQSKRFAVSHNVTGVGADRACHRKSEHRISLELLLTTLCHPGLFVDLMSRRDKAFTLSKIPAAAA